MSAASATPAPSAKCASLTSWETIRPRTRPGASPTHSTCLPSEVKKASAASALCGAGRLAAGQLDQDRRVEVGERQEADGVGARGEGVEAAALEAQRPEAGALDRLGVGVGAGALRRLGPWRVLGTVGRGGIVVVAAPGLAAEPARGDHPRLDRVRLPARLVEALLPEGGGDVEVDVDPDQVGELERAHPESAPEAADAVDLLVIGDPGAEQPQPLERVGPGAAVADEADLIGRPHRRAAHPPGDLGRLLASASSADSSPATTSTSRISAGGLKKCMPTTRLGPGHPGGDLGHRERGGVGGEDGLRAADLRQRARTARASAPPPPGPPRSPARTRRGPPSSGAGRGAPRRASASAALQRPLAVPFSSAERSRAGRRVQRLGDGVVQVCLDSRRGRRAGRSRRPWSPPRRPRSARDAIRSALTRPRNSGRRFSVKACMPSTRSSVAIASS